MRLIDRFEELSELWGTRHCTTPQQPATTSTQMLMNIGLGLAKPKYSRPVYFLQGGGHRFESCSAHYSKGDLEVAYSLAP